MDFTVNIPILKGSRGQVFKGENHFMPQFDHIVKSIAQQYTNTWFQFDVYLHMHNPS